MTVLDTNFLIAVLRGKGTSEATVDMYEDPKTTMINVFELYFGAMRSDRTKEVLSETNSLLKSIDIIEDTKNISSGSSHLEFTCYLVNSHLNILLHF